MEQDDNGQQNTAYCILRLREASSLRTLMLSPPAIDLAPGPSPYREWRGATQKQKTILVLPIIC
ncbi:MAG: hypothetical protein M3342_12105 [Bacteroidota bacterium]|nr:hypothetical protein [Bacteroidota bacterium]